MTDRGRAAATDPLLDQERAIIDFMDRGQHAADHHVDLGPPPAPRASLERARALVRRTP